MNLLSLICDRPQRSYWFFFPCFTHPSRLSGTSWEKILGDTLSWCKQTQPCFRYQMLISQMNFSEETLNLISVCCSPLPACSPVVAVLRGNRIQKPGVKLPVTIHFLPTDDGERCVACSFTWFIKNTQRARQTLERRQGKGHLISAEWLAFEFYLHNWLFALKWWINQNTCMEYSDVFWGKGSVHCHWSMQDNMRASASLLMRLRLYCVKLKHDDERQKEKFYYLVPPKEIQ